MSYRGGHNSYSMGNSSAPWGQSHVPSNEQQWNDPYQTPYYTASSSSDFKPAYFSGSSTSDHKQPYFSGSSTSDLKPSYFSGSSASDLKPSYFPGSPSADLNQATSQFNQDIPDNSWQAQSGWQRGETLGGGYTTPQQSNSANMFNKSIALNRYNQGSDSYSDQPVNESFSSVKSENSFSGNMGHSVNRMSGPYNPSPNMSSNFHSMNTPRGSFNPHRGGIKRSFSANKQVPTTWPPKVKKAKVQNSTNPLQMVHELGIKITWDITESPTPPKTYTATANHNHMAYTSSGSSKKAAMHAAAKLLLQALGKPVPTGFDSPQTPSINSVSELHKLLSNKKITYRPEFLFDPDGPPFTCRLFLEGRVFQAQASTKKIAKSLVAQKVLDAFSSNAIDINKLPTSEAQVKKETVAEDLAGSSSLIQLHQNFLASDMEWEFHTHQFQTTVTNTVTLKLQEQFYTATDTTRKAAKSMIATMVLADLSNGKLTPTKKSSTSEPKPEKAVKRKADDTDEPAEKKVRLEENPISQISCVFHNIEWNFSREGPPHAPVFTALSSLPGYQMTFSGKADTKKKAKAEASKEMLKALEAGIIKAPEKPVATPKTPTPKLLNRSIDKENDDAHIGTIVGNHFGKLNWSTESSVGPSGEPVVTLTVELEGKTFVGTGSSKTLAKHDGWRRIYDALLTGELTTKVGKNVVPRFNKLFKGPITVTFDGSTYNGSYTVGDRLFTAAGAESAERAEKVVAEQVIEALERREIASIYTTKKPNPDTPLSVLHQISPLKIEFNDVQEMGKNKIFIVKTVYEGKEYSGSGRSKTAAKQNCASVILSEKFNYQFDVGKFNDSSNGSDIRRGDIGGMNHQALSTKVQSLVTDMYVSLAAKFGDKIPAKKVLAGCVLTFDDNVDSAKLITVAAGTKCIDGGSMSIMGEVVNDMHAEILVRRALKRYLYKQVTYSQSGLPSILEASADGSIYKVKEGIKFHLYISSPPCGDSRIFTVSDELAELTNETKDSNPNRANRGQLRVKIENGQGTVPISNTERSGIQTLEAIMSGERYLNMSCSDKVARWTVLGFQGCLLTNLISPVYFSSVIIGSMFHQEHIYRGLYGRFKDMLTPDQYPGAFHHHCPEIIGTITSEQRNAAKAPNQAFIWQETDDKLEVLETKTGKTTECQSSSVCKRALFNAYKSVVGAKKMTKDSYDLEKRSASNYQEIKKKLYKAIEEKGLGEWVCKPIEQDMFFFVAPPVPTSKPTDSTSD